MSTDSTHRPVAGEPAETATRPRVSRRWLLGLAIANLVANCGIVVTGGVVRLTGSGLGCPTWPRCTDESFVPHGSLGLHGAIEFGNRLLTFVLAAIALLTFLACLRAADRVTTRIALGIGLGIPAQAVIGGITVLTDLNPWVVAFHLLVSMAMIMLCVVLVDRLRHPMAWTRPAPHAAGVRRLAWLTFGVGWVVLYLGTVVTGSGPHAGDEDAPRNDLDPQLFSHVHAFGVYALVILTVLLIAAARRAREPALLRAAWVLLAIEAAQGVVGFAQYFTGLPIALVALHLAGAAITAAALAWVLVRALRRPDPADAAPRRPEVGVVAV